MFKKFKSTGFRSGDLVGYPTHRYSLNNFEIFGDFLYLLKEIEKKYSRCHEIDS